MLTLKIRNNIFFKMVKRINKKASEVDGSRLEALAREIAKELGTKGRRASLVARAEFKKNKHDLIIFSGLVSGATLLGMSLGFRILDKEVNKFDF